MKRVCEELEGLLERIGQFLGSHAQHIVTMAEQLGVGAEARDLAGEAKEGLQTLRGWLEEVAPEITHLHAMRGSLAVLEPLLEGLVPFVEALQGHWRELGLEIPDEKIQPVQDVLGAADTVAEKGQRLHESVPLPEQLQELLELLTALEGKLDSDLVQPLG